jgi:long-chain acyl-CoA synthetase
MVTYADKPWLNHYDPGVPLTLEPYPDLVLHDFLRDTARQCPDRTALITPAKLPVLGHQAAAITYRQLDQYSDALACALLNLGLKKGEVVAVVMPNVAAFAIAYYGILKAGGVVAATNPTYPADKMQFQIDDCDARIVITLSLFYNLIKQVQPRTKVKTVIVTNVAEYLPPAAAAMFKLLKEKKDGHRIERLAPGDLRLADILHGYAGQMPPNTVQPDDLALFQYTGGTTGVSKAAMATHKALVANTLQIIAWTTVTEGPVANLDRSSMVFLGALPMFHVFGLVVMLSQAMSTGARIVLIPNPRDIDNMVEMIHHYKPTVFLGVPAMFNAVNNHPRVKSGEVRFDSVLLANSGAAPLPPAVQREFISNGARTLYEGYGMSELPTATHSNPIVGENKVGSVGMPLPDIECRIVSLDDGVTEVPIGEIGELIMRGPNLMKGYYKLPTETANALREKDGKIWMYTGDIARMDEDGYFYIVDRKKDMVLIGGFNVYPTNIEKVLKDHPAVLEVAVAGVPHETRIGQETLKAWVVFKPGMSATPEELIKLCEERLAPYEVPRRFSFVSELPKTTVGKTLRRELVQRELEEREAMVSANAG